MKKQIFLSLLTLFIIGAHPQILNAGQSGARVPFTKGNVSDASKRTIESFFDETTKELKRDELYLYLGHPSISTGRDESADFSGKNSAVFYSNYGYKEYVRMPIFVRQLMNTREDFLRHDTPKTRKTKLTDFMEALLQHGNIQTTVGCLVNGSDSRCPCCKFENEILLPVFIESVQEDSSLNSKIYNAKLAAIILLFIDQVKSFNLQEVDNFIQMSAAREIRKSHDYTYKIIIPGDKFTLLDLRIRSLLALLNYSITIAKIGTQPAIADIHQKNAFDLANKLAEKFLHEELVDVSFLINLSKEDAKEIETLKIHLEKTILEKTDSIKGIPVSAETTKTEEEIRKAKAQLLSLEVPTAKRITFYHKYLAQFGKYIHTIALTLKGEDAETKQKREELLRNSETILRLVPQDFVEEFAKTSSVNVAEFGNAASESKRILLEKASAPRASSIVDTAAFGSTVSKTRANIAQAEATASKEVSPFPKKIAPKVPQKPTSSIPTAQNEIQPPVVLEPSIVILEPKQQNVSTFKEDVIAAQETPSIEEPFISYRLNKGATIGSLELNKRLKELEKVEEEFEDDELIQEEKKEEISTIDQNIKTFLSFFDQDNKNDFYVENQAFNAFLTQFDAQDIIGMIQTIAANNPYKESALLVRVLITLVSCFNDSQNDMILIGRLFTQNSFPLIKAECAAGSPRKLKAHLHKVKDGTLKTDFETFLKPLL